MTIYKRNLNKATIISRRDFLRKQSPNSEIGVVVVKALANDNLSKRYGIKPSAHMTNKKIHRKFVSNLLTAVPSLTSLSE